MSEGTEREAREAEAARAREKQGSGTVPNVTEQDGSDTLSELKKAVHDYEEKEGDWSKTGG